MFTPAESTNESAVTAVSVGKSLFGTPGVGVAAGAAERPGAGDDAAGLGDAATVGLADACGFGDGEPPADGGFVGATGGIVGAIRSIGLARPSGATSAGDDDVAEGAGASVALEPAPGVAVDDGFP